MMHRRTLCTLIAALTITAVVPAAQSQVVAPIKPGLWQVHSEREVNGERQPDMSERMKNMSPEKRAQIDAMMKQHGVASGTGGMGQVCYSRDRLNDHHGLTRLPTARSTTKAAVECVEVAYFLRKVRVRGRRRSRFPGSRELCCQILFNFKNR